MDRDACVATPSSFSPTTCGEMFQLRRIESSTAAELYITAAPGLAGAAEMFAHIGALLRQAGAHIVQERLFAAAEVADAAMADRHRLYGELDDGVAPTVLAARGTDPAAAVVGTQVHAIAGIPRPRVVRSSRGGAARVFESRGTHYLTANGLHVPGRDPAAAQAQGSFELATDLLCRAGASLHDIARTWIWMQDILDWYPQLNRVRTEFFRANGLLDAPDVLPASTGIGVAPAAGKIAIDLFAAWGTPGVIRRFHAAGRQKSAFEYGSAFARAASILTPAGRTVFCSGTAAIDAQGNTCFRSDAAGQIRCTLENVDAVLDQTGCSREDIVHSLVYCASPAVARQLHAVLDQMQWPFLTLIGDVCRPDLLFEVEVTACQPGLHA